MLGRRKSERRFPCGMGSHAYLISSARLQRKRMTGDKAGLSRTAKRAILPSTGFRKRKPRRFGLARWERCELMGHACLPEFYNVLRLISGRLCDFDEPFVKALVNQDPHAAASFACQGCFGGRPRRGYPL